MTNTSVHVGVELGGTKVVVGASAEGPDLLYRCVIPTVDPESTLAAVRNSIEHVMDKHRVLGIGVASFGPIDIRPGSSTYGVMLQTPKPGWSGADVLSGIAPPDMPTVLDTDVAAAMLAEHVWGIGTSDNGVYFTVGTGIGAALWSGGGVLHGANHSEIGHLRVPRHPDDVFPGSCPFHGDCLEGMASGTAISQRWGFSAEALGDKERAALAFESWYLAHAIASLCAVVPVDQVIIGGGVAKLSGFHSGVSAMLARASGGYPAVPFATGGPQILPPELGDDAGVIGAIELGRGFPDT
jgi:fructokinase